MELADSVIASAADATEPSFFKTATVTLPLPNYDQLYVRIVSAD
jgi:hypothetical protein